MQFNHAEFFYFTEKVFQVRLGLNISGQFSDRELTCCGTEIFLHSLLKLFTLPIISLKSGYLMSVNLRASPENKLFSFLFPHFFFKYKFLKNASKLRFT